MEYEYFYGASPKKSAFYKTPKVFYTDVKYKKLSSDAKALYSIMLDRMSLSTKNDWRDEQGRIFIYMTVDNVEELIGCARQKAVSLIKELNDYGLIEKRKQGQSKPTIIYVKDVMHLGHGRQEEDT